MEDIEWGRAVPSPGPALSFSDVASQAYEDQKRVANDSAHYWNLVDTYDEVNDRIKKATGVELSNPAREAPTTGKTTFSVLSDIDPIANWRKRVGEIKGDPKHQSVMSWDGIEDEPERLAWQRMRAVREASTEQRERTGTVDRLPYIGSVPVVGSVATWGYNALRHPQYAAAELAGSLAAQAMSPVDIIPNALGFGAGHYTDSILKAALKNSVVNAGIQAPLSAVKQGDYRRAGLPYGWGTWWQEVEGAAGVGFALDAGIRAPGRFAIERFGRDTPAGTPFSRNTERGGLLLDAPERLELPPAPSSRPPFDPALVKKAKDGDTGALREIAEKTGAIEDPAVKGMIDYVETHGAIDDATAAFFRQAGIDNGEGLRTLAQALRGETGHVRTPDAIPAAKAPLMVDEARALLSDPKTDAILSGLDARVSRLIQDGLDAGLPDIVKTVQQHLTTPDKLPEALTKLAEEMGGPEKLADLVAIHSMRGGPLAVAEAMRRSPELVDSNVPLKTDFMMGARSIAALDDAAFEKARAGDVPPPVAALVSDIVARETQARVIDDLAKAGITDVEAARAAIPDLIPGPKSETPLDAGATVKAPGDAGAKAQTKMLEAEHAEALAQAMAPVEARRQVESQIETIKGEIAKLEERQDAELGKPPKEPKAEAEPEPNPLAETVAQVGDALGVDVRSLIETPQEPSAPKASVTDNLMAKRAELDAALVEKARLDALLDGKPDLSPALRMVMESAALQRSLDVRRAIDDALRLAQRMLPEGTKVDVVGREMRDPVSGALVDAFSDINTGDVTLATYALNPAARIGHEGLHTLVTRGLVAPQEIRLLAGMARRMEVGFDETKYREAYRGRPGLDALIEEEAAAHLIEAVIKGQVNVDTPTGVIARVKMMIQRVRNALNGYGFQTEEDLARAIINGDVARRAEVKQLPGSHFPEGTLFAIRTDEKTGKRYIEAFHGSPHDFDRFDMSKIGTGEGAQAYGHGLYFADEEAVAKTYRDMAKERKPGGFNSRAEAYATYRLNKFNGDREAAARSAEQFADSEKGGWLKKGNTVEEDAYRKAAALLRDPAWSAHDNPGRMYQVRINADPDTFLDWDKPLSQQSEAVKQAASNAWDIPVDKLHDDLFARKVPPHISEKLKANGIPGIKYLDQGSRAAGDGSRNYVLFSDDIVEITHKDGKPVLSSVGSAIRSLVSHGDASAASPEAKGSRVDANITRNVNSKITGPQPGLGDARIPLSSGYWRVDAPALEYKPDGGIRDAVLLANVSEAPAMLEKGLGFLKVPRQRMVFAAMDAVLQNLKVRESVIKSIPVDVVNVLAGRKTTPEMLFNDVPMFLDLLSTNGDKPVSLGGNAAREALRVIASSAAKEALVSTGDAGALLDRGAARGANGLDHSAIIKELASVGNVYDSLISITHKDGKPVSPEERSSVTSGMKPDTGTLFAMRDDRPVTPGLDMSAVARQEMSVWQRIKSLVLSDKARIARAVSHGFDVNTVLYHGARERYAEMKVRPLAGSDGHGVVWLTPDRSAADFYADYRSYGSSGGYTHSVVIRPGRQLVVDARGDGPLTIGSKHFENEIEDTAQKAWQSVIEATKGGAFEKPLSEIIPQPGASAFEALASWRKDANYFGKNVAEYTSDLNVIGRVKGFYEMPGDVRKAVDNAVNNPLVLTSELLKRAYLDGYDSVKFLNVIDSFGQGTKKYDQIAVFDPSNIRSVNAAFDPAHSDSPNLLYAMRDTPTPEPTPPLHTEVAMLDRLSRMSDLVMACR